MAAVIPPALKAADIARFAQRAGQVEKARPAVAYWCNYWIVDQIIAKGLHQADDDSKNYTMHLMDKLEQAKQDFAENDAIVDDMAGHAYIEQFGQETFQRAENAMKANKASRQTADTFLAAATFLDLCQIWGPLDPEIASKIKFAKYHALRIAKAVKAGEDPNMSNPTPVLTPSVEQPPLDNYDPDVKMLDDSSRPNRQVSVEDAPDNAFIRPPELDQAPSPQEESYYHNAAATEPEVSPMVPSSTDRKMSENGGYFPSVPDGTGDPAPYDSAVPLPNASSLPPPSSEPGFSLSPASASTGPHTTAPRNTDKSNIHPLPPSTPRQLPQPHLAPGPAAQSVSTRLPVAGQAAPASSTDRLSRHSDQFQTDEMSIVAAQKHAKFAISALNFEDVKTAVQELREALEVLGAR